MSWRGALVMVATVGSLLCTVVVIPVREWMVHESTRLSAEQAAAHVRLRSGLNVPARRVYEEQKAMILAGEGGGAYSAEPVWPPRFVLVWESRPRPLVWGRGRVASRLGFRRAERVNWPILFIEQALILVLGGGLLTWVVRRERRKRAAA